MGSGFARLMRLWTKRRDGSSHGLAVGAVLVLVLTAGFSSDSRVPGSRPIARARLEGVVLWERMRESWLDGE